MAISLDRLAADHTHLREIQVIRQRDTSVAIGRKCLVHTGAVYLVICNYSIYALYLVKLDLLCRFRHVNVLEEGTVRRVSLLLGVTTKF